MLSALNDSPIVAGAIESPTVDFWIPCHNIDQFHPFLSSRKERTPPFIPGANIGFRRMVLESLGGFEPAEVMAEDMECVLHAGRADIGVIFRSEVVVRHVPQRTDLLELLGYAADLARDTVHLRRNPATFPVICVLKTVWCVRKCRDLLTRKES